MIDISELFPAVSRILLTGGGKEFLERLGVDAARQVVAGIFRGENVRSQTEPLTRRRIAQVTGAMLILFAEGVRQQADFAEVMPQLALEQLTAARRADKSRVWPSLWLLGLTDKAVQNVIRGSVEARVQYLSSFNAAVDDAAERCATDLGVLKMTLGYATEAGKHVAELDWRAIHLLTTAIGSATLALRGSDKSMYGKLFERLVLGSALSVLGFSLADPMNLKSDRGLFWLSDSRDLRECDATALIEPGKLVRFDLGFIGRGNPEIVRDKLTRFLSELKREGTIYTSRSFIIIDKLPDAGNTRQIAQQAGVELLQMSMQYWPRDLAQRLRDSVGYAHPLCDMDDAEAEQFMQNAIQKVDLQDFLRGISTEQMEGVIEENV